jgi:uncharacterized membrane protein YgcG
VIGAGACVGQSQLPIQRSLKRIFTDVIMPRFKVDDCDGGMKAGVDAVIAAVSTTPQH